MMMRRSILVLISACSASGSPSDPAGPDGGSTGSGDGSSRQAIYDAVDPDNLHAKLLELTGGTPVTVDGEPYMITNRWSAAAKAKFRSYWEQYFRDLGATVSEQTFAIPNLVGESQGHNVEAVFPGQSADSIVIITHYDTVGITGKETLNPGADDAGSGLAMEMEAGRLFAQYANRKYTVRIVAADYEEISNDLDGDYAYVAYLRQKAQAQSFKIVAASDGDQTGWSCWSENLCGTHPPAKNTTFQVISCSGDSKHYDYPDLSQGMIDMARSHGSAITPTAICDGSGDTDHYPFWVAGIPAYVIEEWGSENNPHYDDTGNDTMAHIDLDYLTATARIQIAFQAKLAGIGD